MIGRRLAAYGTGIGKALLRDFTLEQLRETYPDGLRPLTAHTVTDFSELYRQLQEDQSTRSAYERRVERIGPLHCRSGRIGWAGGRRAQRGDAGLSL